MAARSDRRTSNKPTVERETYQQGRKRNQRRRRDYAGDVAWLIHWAKIFCEHTIILFECVNRIECLRRHALQVFRPLLRAGRAAFRAVMVWHTVGNPTQSATFLPSLTGVTYGRRERGARVWGAYRDQICHRHFDVFVHGHVCYGDRDRCREVLNVEPLSSFVVRVEDGVCSMRYLIIDVALAATMTSLFIVVLAAVAPGF